MAVEPDKEAIARFEARIFTDPRDRRWPYRLLAPERVDPGRRLPLVLFLHGIGERGDDNERQLTNAVWRFADPAFAPELPFIVVVPQCPADSRWVEIDGPALPVRQASHPAPALATALDIVSVLEKELPVDPKAISAVGISMGGFGVWDLVTRYNDVFAAAVPICGGGDETRAGLLGKTPLWAFHGACDEVVPAEQSRRMIEAIRRVGGSPRYTEYLDVGHNAWDPAFSEPDLFPWLLKQHLAR